MNMSAPICVDEWPTRGAGGAPVCLDLAPEQRRELERVQVVRGALAVAAGEDDDVRLDPLTEWPISASGLEVEVEVEVVVVVVVARALARVCMISQCIVYRSSRCRSLNERLPSRRRGHTCSV